MQNEPERLDELVTRVRNVLASRETCGASSRQGWCSCIFFCSQSEPQDPEVPDIQAANSFADGNRSRDDPMSELRRLKMKIGDVEFEAEVAKDEVYPMYDQFLSMLGERRLPPGKVGFVETSRKAFDQSLPIGIFDLRQDGTIVLKVLPEGPDKVADAMLLLLYGYYLLKNEECVLATQLFRAAEQSGISLRRPAKECVKNGRFVLRNGQRKGSNYALNNQGLAVAKEITAKMLDRSPPGDVPIHVL
jgi:hypothetical protein